MQGLRLERARTALAAVDLQERLLPAIFEHERVIQNSVRLIRGAAILGVPLLVSSRTKENYQIGLQRMKDSGAVIVSTEMALFELLGSAGTKKFKKILELVK